MSVRVGFSASDNSPFLGNFSAFPELKVISRVFVFKVDKGFHSKISQECTEILKRY